MANYFISYVFVNNNGLGYGAADIDASPIRSGDDVARIAKQLESDDPNLGTVGILYWQRFEEDEHGQE